MKKGNIKKGKKDITVIQGDLGKEGLKRKVAKGAKVILRDYRRVFERLAEYDRT